LRSKLQTILEVMGIINLQLLKLLTKGLFLMRPSCYLAPQNLILFVYCIQHA
jgi:hypothetical protein